MTNQDDASAEVGGDGSLLGTYDFWQPAMGSIALIAFGTIAAVVQLPPLPDP